MVSSLGDVSVVTAVVTVVTVVTLVVKRVVVTLVTGALVVGAETPTALIVRALESKRSDNGI